MTIFPGHGPSVDPDRGTESCTGPGPGPGRTGSSRARICLHPATSVAVIAVVLAVVVVTTLVLRVVAPASMRGVALDAMNLGDKAFAELGIPVGGGPDAAARGPPKNRPRPLCASS